MNDTDPKIADRVREMLMAKSGEERMRLGFSAMALARRMVTSSIRDSEPHLTPSEMRQRIFLRYYAQDFSAEERQEILAWLDNATFQGKSG